MTYDEIKDSEVYNRNFTIKYEFESSDTVEKNAVISQDLTVGESVLQGSEIKLVISSGVEEIEVPLVIGMDYATARYKLVKAGLKVTKKVVDNPGGNTEDEVCDANVVAGIKVEKGTEIVLSVWDVDPDAPAEEEKEDSQEGGESADTTVDENASEEDVDSTESQSDEDESEKETEDTAESVEE